MFFTYTHLNTAMKNVWALEYNKDMLQTSYRGTNSLHSKGLKAELEVNVRNATCCRRE